MTEKQKIKAWEKEWWKDQYPLCKECVKECKQSWKLIDMNCNKFVKKS